MSVSYMRVGLGRSLTSGATKVGPAYALDLALDCVLALALGLLLEQRLLSFDIFCVRLLLALGVVIIYCAIVNIAFFCFYGSCILFYFSYLVYL